MLRGRVFVCIHACVCMFLCVPRLVRGRVSLPWAPSRPLESCNLSGAGRGCGRPGMRVCVCASTDATRVLAPAPLCSLTCCDLSGATVETLAQNLPGSRLTKLRYAATPMHCCAWLLRGPLFHCEPAVFWRWYSPACLGGCSGWLGAVALSCRGMWLCTAPPHPPRSLFWNTGIPEAAWATFFEAVKQSQLKDLRY